MTERSSAARSEPAPTGKLRVGANMSNFLLTTKDPATGEPRGIAADLGCELGKRLGVPVGRRKTTDALPDLSMCGVGEKI